MRDFVAVILAVILFGVALSLATSLQWHRKGHTRRRQQIRSRGRSIVAEIPAAEGLVYFTEDSEAFHWAEETVLKNQIQAVHVLINGAPIATSRARRFPSVSAGPAPLLDDGPDGIERDRWDVAIETAGRTAVIECGAIRERVSQELAREIFEAVRAAIESCDEP
jgi:hypothetical protein